MGIKYHEYRQSGSLNKRTICYSELLYYNTPLATHQSGTSRVSKATKTAYRALSNSTSTNHGNCTGLYSESLSAALTKSVCSPFRTGFSSPA